MFTGQTRDSETGLDFFNARFMSAAQGRFLSPDPFNAGADPTDPQSWNANAYVRGNPLALVDPTGMFLSALPPPDSGDDSEDPGDPCFSCWNYYCNLCLGSGGASPSQPPPPPPPIKLTFANPPKNGRNCTVNPVSAGQYAAATAQVALLTAQFFSGLGSADQTFGPNSATSQVMAQSGPVQDVLNDYYMTGRTSNLYTFGAQGYAAAGANPVAQFVGSFRYTISPTNGGINLRLTNTTSFRSLTYDKGPQWPRFPIVTPNGVYNSPMGNTHQVYNIFVPCGG